MIAEYTREELSEILVAYGIDRFSDYRMVDSSHGESDIRQNYIIDNRYVLRVNSAQVMTEQRLAELNGLIARYNDFGIRAPYFIQGTDGCFLQKDGASFVYLSEYLDMKVADDLLAEEPGVRPALTDQRLALVSKYAERYKNQNLTKTRSMYSVFDLSPYDEPMGIDEKQQGLDELLSFLRENGETELADQFEMENKRIRDKLIGIYRDLPCCVFQGDENFSNVCVDENGQICGLFDFNMSGTDVCANYLANLAFQGRFYYKEKVFDTHDADWAFNKVLESFHDATELIRRFYHFTEPELDAYYLYARLVMIAGYVNVCAFRYYLEQPQYREEGLWLLNKVIRSVKII